MIQTDGDRTVAEPFPVDPGCPPNPAIEPDDLSDERYHADPATDLTTSVNALWQIVGGLQGRVVALEADNIHADDARVEQIVEDWVREDIQSYAGEIPCAISEALDNSDLDNRVERLENRLDAI